MRTSDTARVQRRYDRQAFMYDLKEAPVELFARRFRRWLWSGVRGRMVLEVGVGTGKNMRYHPEGARLVAVDISARMLRRAASRARREGRAVDLVLADAQRLPFRDGAFDAGTATFVFCSVPDPVAGLGELRRVVGQHGQVHLVEHVRSANRLAGALMDLMNPIVVRLSGANINRDTVSNVAKAGLALGDVESRWFGIVKLIRAWAGPATEAVAGLREGSAITAEEATSDVAHG